VKSIANIVKDCMWKMEKLGKFAAINFANFDGNMTDIPYN
jgi:hypothetical protein